MRHQRRRDYNRLHGADGTLKIWDGTTGTCIRSFTIDKASDMSEINDLKLSRMVVDRSCSMSADGKRVLVAVLGQLKLVDMEREDGVIDVVSVAGSSTCFAISADGSVAVTGVDRDVIVQDLRPGAQAKILQGHT